jgi:hypothetical protein
VPKISNQALNGLADLLIREAARLADARGCCAECGSPLPIQGDGRPQIYCNHRCRNAAYNKRKAGP